MKTIKTGITGLKEAGKTIFLTSMINNLLEFNEDKMPELEEEGIDLSCKEVILKKGINKFKYQKYLAAFRANEPNWPNKTVDRSQFNLELSIRANTKVKKVQIQFIDYPGERLLDLTLLRRDFSRWSDDVIEDNAKLGLKEELSKDWLEACEYLNNVNANEIYVERAIEKYEKYIRKCLDKNLNNLQPSAMVFRAEGLSFPEEEKLDLGFCPLPADVRKMNPKLTKLFEKKYQKYVKQYVKPFEKNVIKKCSNQIVLADVLQLLQDGADSYNDARACLNAALESYGYFQKTNWYKLNIFRRWISSNVKQVMFVATKADECSKSSRSNLKFLIKNLVEKKYKELKFDLPDDKIFFEYCSAHKSTKDKVKDVNGKITEGLEGKLEANRKNGVFQALNIPKTWPEDLFWERFIDKNYFLKFLPPRLPKRDGAVIKHINLDRILSTILKPLI